MVVVVVMVVGWFVGSVVVRMTVLMVMSVLVLMSVLMSVMMLMSMSVLMSVMVVVMVMLMRMRMRLMTCRLPPGACRLELLRVGHTVQRNLHIHRMDAGDQRWLCFDVPAIDRQRGQTFAQFLEGHAAIEQRTEGHITGDAGKTIEIKQRHSRDKR